MNGAGPVGGPAAKFPWGIFRRLVLIEIAIILAALAGSGLAGRYFFKRQILAEMVAQTRDSLASLSQGLASEASPAWCESRARGTSVRLTLIADDGRVICDSGHDASTMENHADRPEVRAALAPEGGGAGESLRRSDTLGEDMLYVARRVPDAHLVLREAIPLERLASILRYFDTSFALFLLAAAGALTAFAVWVGRGFVVPIERLILKATSEGGEGGARAYAHGIPLADASGVALVDASGVALVDASGVALDDASGVALDDASGVALDDEWGDLERAVSRIQSDLRRQTETLSREREELDVLLSGISDAVLTVDRDGNPLFFNSRFTLLFGGDAFVRERSRLGEVFRAPDVLAAFREALAGDRARTDGPVRVALALHVRGEAVPRHFSLSVAPLRREPGAAYGAIGVFHDITELKRAERIRIDFVANVSHELRTPLTSIKGYSDTLREDVASGRLDDVPRFVDIISKNADRLLNLIGDLLDLSSLEAGSPGVDADVPRSAQLATRELTERVVAQLEPKWKPKDQRIALDFAAASVRGDAGRIEQVLVNLLDNAVKYAPVGGRISVAWTPTTVDGGIPAVALRVADDGPGIPAEHHARLFERFYRVDRSRSREQGGTGLGLAIVKHIVQLHGGSVTVRSEPGRGAEFTCVFPLAGAKPSR